MAERDDGENGATEDPATLLKSLEKKALLNKYLFIGVLSFTGIVLSVMATAMVVMFLKLSSLSEAAAVQEEKPYEEQFVELEKQLMLLADFRKSELKVIEDYSKRLDSISSNCDVSKAAPYRDFLVSREADFQRFIETLKNGTNSLAKMNQGSKQWLDGFNKEMDELKGASAARQSTLDTLLSRSGKN